MADGNGEYGTTIGPDAKFKGQLQFEKGARLLGTFEGEITTKGKLIIAENGKLSGEAHAGNIRVEGKVKGNLHAGGKVQLAASARLEGDIRAARLEVAEGAVLVGNCAVGTGDGAGQREVKSASAPVERVQPKPERPQVPAPIRK